MKEDRGLMEFAKARMEADARPSPEVLDEIGRFAAATAVAREARRRAWRLSWLTAAALAGVCVLPRAWLSNRVAEGEPTAQAIRLLIAADSPDDEDDVADDSGAGLLLAWLDAPYQAALRSFDESEE